MNREELLERYNNFYQYYSHEDFINIMFDYEQGKQNQENLIKYIEDKINMCDGYIDTTKSDLEELKYTMFAHDKLKKTIDGNIKARNIYQDLLERIKSNNYEN